MKRYKLYDRQIKIELSDLKIIVDEFYNEIDKDQDLINLNRLFPNIINKKKWFKSFSLKDFNNDSIETFSLPPLIYFFQNRVDNISVLKKK